MYNLRYHIVSIVAVFLALALGLVLGGLIGDQTSSLQSNLANNITQQLSQIRDEDALVKTESSRLTNFGNESVTLLTAGRLQGKTILLIGATGLENKQATQVLQQAGAKVVVAALDASRYKAGEKNLQSAQLADSLKAQYKQNNDLSALAAGFADEWSVTATSTPASLVSAGPAQRPVTAALQNDGILKLSVDPETLEHFDGVVNIAQGAKDAPDSFGLTLMQAFDHKGVAAIAAQMSDSSSTLGSAVVGLDLSATDLLGTPMGDWTVVAVLDGAPRVPYGTLDGASRLYPPVK